jgi:hypothetical protein
MTADDSVLAMSTMRRIASGAGLTREQQCALHLWDLCRAYPRDPAWAAARVILEEHRLRGAETRRQAAVAQASRMRASPAFQLLAARRKLIKLLRARGGLTTRSENGRQEAKSRRPPGLRAST